MVIMNEATSNVKGSKPLICPKCRRGRIGSVPVWSKTTLSARGQPPPDERCECIYIRCSICGAYVPLTIE